MGVALTASSAQTRGTDSVPDNLGCVFDHAAALAEFHRVLVPGGLLAIVINNPRSRWAMALQPPAVRGLAYFPPPEEMRSLVEATGFIVVEQRPVHRPLPNSLVPDVLTVARR
ncbi:hypothetical protein [Nocardia sp. CA-120079]|uniref:hypothetical protein n=1 Tax=Nocardia sp. CA-120079 TaxID=3239974 RepID=UPI003D984758